MFKLRYPDPNSKKNNVKCIWKKDLAAWNCTFTHLMTVSSLAPANDWKNVGGSYLFHLQI